MADPHLGLAELKALESSVESAAQGWQRLRGYAKSSETAQAFNDPGYFERQADAMFSDRLRPMALQNRQALDTALASRASSGMMGGVGQKERAGIAAEFQGAATSLRGDADEWAAGRRTENEAAFMALQSQLSGAEQGVIAAQQRLAARLGQQAAYDPQYKQARWYAPTGAASQEFFGTVGWDTRSASQMRAEQARRNEIARQMRADNRGSRGYWGEQ